MRHITVGLVSMTFALAMAACGTEREPSNAATPADLQTEAQAGSGAVATDENWSNLGSREVDTPDYDPCEDKVCGDPCSLCDPEATDCFETAELKQCDSRGICRSGEASCGGQALPDPGDRYDPCAGKACGEPCSRCNPADPVCVDTADLKVCSAEGICGRGTPCD